jgi:DNA-binding response OmpR family regulator
MSIMFCTDGRALLRHKRILIAEDEALVALLEEDGLLEAGADVVGPVTTVDEALRLIEQAEQYGGLSGAILDINLGGELVSRVADRLAELDVPFIFVTGYCKGCETTDAHADAPVLTKPFDPRELIAALHALTATNRRSHSLAHEPSASSAYRRY